MGFAFSPWQKTLPFAGYNLTGGAVEEGVFSGQHLTGAIPTSQGPFRNALVAGGTDFRRPKEPVREGSCWHPGQHRRGGRDPGPRDRRGAQEASE